MEDKNKLGKVDVGWLIVLVFAAIALVVVFAVFIAHKEVDAVSSSSSYSYKYDDYSSSSYLSSVEKAAKEAAEKIEKEKNMYTVVAFIGSAVFFGILIAILVFVRKIYGVLDNMRIGLESEAMPSLDSKTKGGCEEEEKK